MAVDSDSTTDRPVVNVSLKAQLEPYEKQIIQQALESCGGNRQLTAGLLCINRTTLFNKMRKYGLLPTSRVAG